MKPEWKRKYAKGDAQHWTLRAENFSITILDNHHDYQGKWIMHAFIFKIDTKILKASSAEEAKKESIEIVKDIVRKYVDDIKEVCGEEPKHRELNGG